MKTRSIYLAVRIDIQCPDGYDGSDEDLLSELARWYDIEIFYQNPSLKDLHFTASFQRSSNMEEVISLLERTQKIKVNVNGKTLIVQNK